MFTVMIPNAIYNTVFAFANDFFDFKPIKAVSDWQRINKPKVAIGWILMNVLQIDRLLVVF
ncbi:protein of unknown function [Xenorhabdus poinarii G6]|uniref:Uncharacterized protein n=1 Tax=Xenorhabdus poinarii G6 TaxID=1354304 RepID=A0A068R2I4_9GAMM|nr:protein of unknown function [Xenorhabdus poinarii G6]